MKNIYDIRGDTTAIIWTKPNGKTYEILIDTADLGLADEVPGTWGVNTQRSGYQLVSTLVRQSNGKRRTVLLARHLMKPGSLHVDHISGDTLDNRRSNLRLATRSQNLRNQAKHVNNTSGFKGVTWHKAAAKWSSHIRVNGKTIHLGVFDNAYDAAVAYDAAATNLHAEFARLNFSEERVVNETK